MSDDADPYTYPGSAVLRNKLGLTDAAKLDRLERQLVSQRAAEGIPDGDFDLAHLRAIHRHLFQDVYEWAGRTHDERVLLSDGTSASEPIPRKIDGKPFMVGARIPQELDRIVRKLLQDKHLRGFDQRGIR